jgi:hypothetical protein
MKPKLGTFVVLPILVGLALGEQGIQPSNHAHDTRVGGHEIISTSSTDAPRGASTSLIFDSQFNNFQHALATAQNEPNSDRQSRLISKLNDWLTAQGPDAAIELLNKQPPSALVVDLKTRFIRKLAETDPHLAAASAMKLNDPGRQQALEGALIVWAGQNLEAAISWVGELPEGVLKDGVERSVAYEAARTDPLTALNLVSSQSSSPERDNLIAYAVAQWADIDPKSAANWASQAKSGPLKDEMMKMIATNWAESDPAAAAALALHSLPAGRDQEDALTGIVQRWTEADPQAAADWVIQFPEGQLRNSAMANLVKLWTDQNPQEVGSWLSTLPINASRDVAVQSYAEQIHPSQPALAMQWAESISNPNLRTQEINSLESVK